MGASVQLATPHRRRLREVWRSAGWPCHDPVELDLLAAGLLQRQWDAQGRETLRLTDAGLQALAAARQRNQAARGPHEALVQRVAEDMQRSGRIAWRGLALRAPLVGADGATQWVVAMPDVFSIRPSTLEDGVEPVVHEVKVSRADLLSDLRRAAKGQAYAALASQCWYVLQAGIAEPDEVPEMYGVLLARPDGLELLRPAPRRPMRMSLAAWVAVARADAVPAPDEAPQAALTDASAAGRP
jgi:hypothetical protein